MTSAWLSQKQSNVQGRRRRLLIFYCSGRSLMCVIALAEWCCWFRWSWQYGRQYGKESAEEEGQGDRLWCKSSGCGCFERSGYVNFHNWMFDETTFFSFAPFIFSIYALRCSTPNTSGFFVLICRWSGWYVQSIHSKFAVYFDRG